MPTLKNKAHETFCLYYVNSEEVGNGTAAAREAFPKQTNGALRTTAYKLLTKADIQIRIDELFAEKQVDLKFDAERWDREAIAATYTNLGHFCDWTSNSVTLKAKADINPAYLPGIASIVIERSPLGVTKTRVTLQPKDRMLALTGNRLGIFRQLSPAGELWVGGTFHRGDQTDGKEKDSKGKARSVTTTHKKTDRSPAQKATGRPRATRSKKQKGSRRTKESRSRAIREKTRRRR